jgi:nucleoside-diphosphate-sugar epimerase
MNKSLLSLGHGYSAAALAKVLVPLGWTIYATTRDASKSTTLAREGVTPILWEDPQLVRLVSETPNILTSIAPTDNGDPVLARFHTQFFDNAERYRWVGYLSTTGVYGDRQGDWVDETSTLSPTTIRGQRRQAAEAAWSAIPNLPLHIFRLAGIYGPGRGPFAKVRNRTAQRIIKPGQVFSRVHVEDIAQTVYASIMTPKPTAIYNVCDDDPAPPQDVIAYAADLLGLPQPDAVDFENALLSPMARSFYAESKRVSNDRIKHELGIVLKYPDFRSGLERMLADETD